MAEKGTNRARIVSIMYYVGWIEGIDTAFIHEPFEERVGEEFNYEHLTVYMLTVGVTRGKQIKIKGFNFIFIDLLFVVVVWVFFWLGGNG